MEFIDNQEPTNFLKLYKLFQSLPAFGKLTSYLLVVDYAIAGRATIPNILDMGYLLGQINAGGLKGLQKLGWPHLTNQMTDDIVIAFEKVYLELESRIPLHCQNQMDFGVFFVEHSLCKLGRLGGVYFRNILV